MDVIPQGTWICRQCHLDSIQLRQRLKVNKKPYEKSVNEECARCLKKCSDAFEFQDGEEATKFQAKFIWQVTCIHCELKFHSICFNFRPQAINCFSCQERIRGTFWTICRYYPKGTRTVCEVFEGKSGENCWAELSLAERGFRALEGHELVQQHAFFSTDFSCKTKRLESHSLL